MTIRRTDAYRQALGDAHLTFNGNAVQFQVRSGANAGIGGQGTLLGQLTGGTPYGTSLNGVVTLTALTSDTSADATGIAGHYQKNTSAGVFIESGLLDGTDGVTIDNTSITLGQQVTASGTWTLTMAYDDGV